MKGHSLTEYQNTYTVFCCRCSNHYFPKQNTRDKETPNISFLSFIKVSTMDGLGALDHFLNCLLILDDKTVSVFTKQLEENCYAQESTYRDSSSHNVVTKTKENTKYCNSKPTSSRLILKG